MDVAYFQYFVFYNIIHNIFEVIIMDYTINYYYKYNGEGWMILQDGDNIIFAKRSALIRLDEDKYSLLYDSENKTKIVSHDISDVDVIFIKKR